MREVHGHLWGATYICVKDYCPDFCTNVHPSFQRLHPRAVRPRMMTPLPHSGQVSPSFTDNEEDGPGAEGGGDAGDWDCDAADWDDEAAFLDLADDLDDEAARGFRGFFSSSSGVTEMRRLLLSDNTCRTMSAACCFSSAMNCIAS